MNLLNILLPVFFVVALGFVLRVSGFIREPTNSALSRLVFYIAAPALLFRSTSRGGFDWSVSLPVLLTIGGITVLLALVVYAASARVAPERRGVFAQGALRSNMVFVGLPVIINAYGNAALGPAAVLIAFMVVVDNLLAVLLLTFPHARRGARDPRLWAHTLWRILTNPLIVGCVGGILCSLLGTHLPVGIDRTLALVGRIAAPLGLICVGAGLDFGKLRAEMPSLALPAAMKLIVYPLIVFLGLRSQGLAGIDLGVPVLITACPTAVVSYIMAREMRGSDQLAGAIVIATTVASLITLLIWLAVLRVA